MVSSATREEIIDLLTEAHNQIAYMHGKFQETGTGNAVMARLDNLRHKLLAPRASEANPFNSHPVGASVDVFSPDSDDSMVKITIGSAATRGKEE